MASYIVLFFIATIAAIECASFNQCGGHHYGQLTTLAISPDPIVLKEGETVTINYDVTTSRTFPSDIKYELDIKRKVGWFGVPLCGFLGDLCKGKVITCDDIKKAENALPDDVKNKLPKYPCPLTPGTYSKQIPFTIPKLPSIPSFLANGEYEIKVILKNAQTEEEIACGELKELNIKM